MKKPNHVVIDCSLFMAGLLQEKDNEYAEEVFDQIVSREISAIVPKLFFIEASNVLVMSLRRGRIQKIQYEQYIELISNAPVKAEERFDVKKITDLATKHQLTVYDATYLEIALYHECKLATCDDALYRIAKKLSIAL